MLIKNLSLSNFRNYEKELLSFSPKTNILTGTNGAGKTNILEAIYVLALARSYKAKDEDMIKYGTDFFKISADIEKTDREENLTLIGSKEGKKVFASSAEIKKLSDFIGRLNVVIFSPEDLLLLKNGPQEKRKLIDLSLLQISKQYVIDYAAFKKQLKLRNDYLKYLLPKIDSSSEIRDDMLEVLTVNFIDCNKKIFESRSRFLKKLEGIAEEKYRQLSGTRDEIKFEYLVNFDNTLDFFKNKYRSDLFLGSTQAGCHHDDIRFTKNGADFETNSSQGEQRMLALSIKLALADLIEKMKKEAPVVLLDDVFSELDINHQNRLLSMIEGNMQIIITTTDIVKIGKPALVGAKIFEIRDGHAKEASNARY